MRPTPVRRTAEVLACGVATDTAEAVEIASGSGIDPRVGPGIGPGIDLGIGPGMNPGIDPGINRGRAEGRRDDCCGSVIYPRGYPPRDTVTFRQYFRRKTQLLSTSIWAEGPGGQIDPAEGALGARYRRFIGESLAQRAMAYALLPNGAMMWDLMSAHPLASLPKPVGYPPIFVIWRRSGGPSKSMHSKVAGISETNDEN